MRGIQLGKDSVGEYQIYQKTSNKQMQMLQSQTLNFKPAFHQRCTTAASNAQEICKIVQSVSDDYKPIMKKEKDGQQVL